MSENQFGVGEKATHFIIDEVAKANPNFRQVLWTGKHSQLVAMTIPVGGDASGGFGSNTKMLQEYNSGPSGYETVWGSALTLVIAVAIVYVAARLLAAFTGPRTERS